MVSFSVTNVLMATLILGIPAKALDAATLLKNGQAAQKLNLAFQTMNATGACIDKGAISAIEATGAAGGVFGNSTTSYKADDGTNDNNDDTDCDISDSDDVSGDSTTTTSPQPTSSLPASTALPTVTQTITKTMSIKSTTIPSPTSPGTVTVTLTVGDQPTTLAAVTRTISPDTASKLLSSLMVNGATIISSPTTTP
ncbi:hypothetical protein C0991_006979 [Blastosporella zonata]|nr:hypothetical protein C0991_006979 [Blastosporella zonata]